MMFSVVIPLYNKSHTIERAIRSVISQTVQDFEIIVVDDGSADDGPQRAARITDQRIRMIHQANQGVSAARNRGIAEARYDLIAFLDADDEWKPTFLETIVRLVGSSPLAAVYATSYLFCRSEGVAWAPILRGLCDPPWEGILDDYFGLAARSDPPVCSSAVVVRRAALQAVGGFPIGVTSGEDLLTWARLATRYKIAFSSQQLSVFHLGGSHTPSRLRRKPQAEDVVGTELDRLLRVAIGRQRRSLRQYASLWHKMRASVTIRAGMNHCALRHAVRAIVLAPTNWRNYPLLAFSLLPARIGSAWFGRVQEVRQARSR